MVWHVPCLSQTVVIITTFVCFMNNFMVLKVVFSWENSVAFFFPGGSPRADWSMSIRAVETTLWQVTHFQCVQVNRTPHTLEAGPCSFPARMQHNRFFFYWLIVYQATCVTSKYTAQHPIKIDRLIIRSGQILMIFFWIWLSVFCVWLKWVNLKRHYLDSDAASSLCLYYSGVMLNIH